jgi:hypothetical protein
MTTPTQDLCEQLELAAYHSPYWRKLFGESKSLIEDQAARIAELESGLRGLSDMYAFAWDSTDGCLWMSPEGTARYESAHKEARRLLGEELMEAGEDGELVPEHEEYRELKARITSLEAKCALLAASLDQSEREVEDLKHDIDRYQEITKAEVEHSASLEAQLQQRGEPVAWRSASFPDGFTTRKDVAERWRHEDGRVIELFDHPAASAAIENAFRLQCQLGINVEYDGSYVTAWKGEVEVTRECAEDDRASATREAISEVAARAGKEKS